MNGRLQPGKVTSLEVYIYTTEVDVQLSLALFGPSMQHQVQPHTKRWDPLTSDLQDTVVLAFWNSRLYLLPRDCVVQLPLLPRTPPHCPHHCDTEPKLQYTISGCAILKPSLTIHRH